jgi:hypothetical protein
MVASWGGEEGKKEESEGVGCKSAIVDVVEEKKMPRSSEGREGCEDTW